MTQTVRHELGTAREDASRVPVPTWWSRSESDLLDVIVWLWGEGRQPALVDELSCCELDDLELWYGTMADANSEFRGLRDRYAMKDPECVGGTDPRGDS